MTRALLLASLLLAAAPAFAEPDAPLPARTALDDYLAAPDPLYRWEHRRTLADEACPTHVLELTSQGWLDAERVDRVAWKHWLTISAPARRQLPKTALLVIGGGVNGEQAPAKADPMIRQLALATGAAVVELQTIPNQPLTFDRDGQARYEDDLIAYGWRRYLETGDVEWLPRLPMVKGALRAMDAAQAFLASEAGGGVEVEWFVVTGGSKRGWTTWLTGLDPRVAAIVPVVIDVLNVIPSMDHHRSAYGFWAPAVKDYVRHGIMGERDNPRYRELLGLVDPYAYRHRLSLPKYVVNAASDQFFLPDSSQFYWDALEGEKYLRYVPNAGHGLKGTDAVQGIAAFAQAVIGGTPRPRYSWTFLPGGAIRVEASTRPSEVKLWTATNPEARDFRLETIGRTWTASEVVDRGQRVFEAAVEAPAKGWRAAFVELTFPGPGAQPLKFTTAVRVTPDVLPHAGWREEAPARPQPVGAGR